MGSIDQTNTSFIPLEASDDFTGLYASTTNFSEILISVETDSTFELVVNFSSDNGTNIGLIKTYTQTTPSITALVYNLKPSLRYFQIVLTNTGATNQTYLRLTTILKSTVIYDPPEEAPATLVDANITNPFLVTRIEGSGGEYLAGNAGKLICEGRNYSGNGDPISATNAALHTFITNPTAISVSVDNFPATQDVSGTVAISSLPDLSGLIVNVDNFPAIQVVSVDNFPAVQAVSGAVDITGQMVDINGQSVNATISNPYLVTRIEGSGGEYLAGNAGKLICEGRNYSGNGDPISATNAALHTFITNPTAISVDISGQVVNANTRDGVGNAITSTSSALDVNIKTNPVIVKEKPAYSLSLTSLSSTSQVIRTSTGCLNSFYVSNIGGSAASYVKFYNSSAAVAGATSLMTIVLHEDTQVYIYSSNMNFGGGLCVRAVNAFADSTADSASGTTSITCFLSPYSE